MNYKHLTPELAITGQIKASDIPAIAAAGFRAIICNRPDGEGFGQPSSDAIGRAAAEAGLAFRYIPIRPGQAAQQAVDAFARALDELPGEVLAYCASGARSANLCAMAQARRRGR